MDTGDTEDELRKQKAKEMSAKYLANYGAHRKWMTREEVADYYSKWAERGKYDEDLCPGVYNGPALAAEEVAELYKERREKVKIIDVACGSGQVGEELAHLGFKYLDGLDPAIGMLHQCRKKKLYRKLYMEFCGDGSLPIEDSIYDCLVISGGMGEGHIPCGGLHEMIRIVKPGGSIVIVMRREYIRYVEEYVDRLQPLMIRLEEENKWESLDYKTVSNYSFEKEGLIFVFKVTKGLSMDKEVAFRRRRNSVIVEKIKLEQQQLEDGEGEDSADHRAADGNTLKAPVTEL